MDYYDRTEIERHLHTIDDNNHVIIEELNKNIEKTTYLTRQFQSLKTQ